MRKISNESIEMFLKQKKFSKGNMYVELTDYYEDDNIVRLKLHNNTIAKIENDEIFISNAGWNSNTTKERLNALLDKLNAGYIFQKKGIWYWNKTDENVTIEFPHNEFVPVDNYLNYILLGGK